MRYGQICQMLKPFLANIVIFRNIKTIRIPKTKMQQVKIQAKSEWTSRWLTSPGTSANLARRIVLSWGKTSTYRDTWVVSEEWLQQQPQPVRQHSTISWPRTTNRQIKKKDNKPNTCQTCRSTLEPAYWAPKTWYNPKIQWICHRAYSAQELPWWSWKRAARAQ